jgi:hypothetical protein
MMARDHLWLLWEWTEDSPLVEELHSRAARELLHVQAYSPAEFSQFDVRSLETRRPSLLWDRAGDIHPEAQRLADWAEAWGCRVVNPARGTLLARDKGLLHQLLHRHQLPVPDTHFLQSHATPDEIAWVRGQYLVLKPVRSGGGEGVKIQVWDEDALLQAMHSRPGVTWLLQEHVEPAIMAGRRAWFRVFYLFGEVRVCWWDNRTHVYAYLPEKEVDLLGLGELITLGKAIGATFPMQLFSTEIVCRQNGKLVIVDYLNDPCDLRSQTRVPDGVPELIINWILDRIFQIAQTNSL